MMDGWLKSILELTQETNPWRKLDQILISLTFQSQKFSYSQKYVNTPN